MSLMHSQITVGAEQWDSSDDEQALVEIAKRNRSAFSSLYRRHYRALAGYVYRRTGDVHATEDLVSDVFLTALRTLPRFRYRGVPVRFWLLRIATNAVNRWARRRRRRAVVSLDEAALEGVGAETAPTDGEVDQERASLALLSLSPKFQSVLSLHYLEGLSIREVGTILGCRDGTVKSRLSRARDALREALARRRSDQ